VEDGVRLGGAGTAIADAVGALDPEAVAPPVLVLGTPDSFIAHGAPAQILAELGLDGRGIAASVRSALLSEVDSTADR
jgi:1-deoxy-D-xylulose-5-phosphate synthase